MKDLKFEVKKKITLTKEDIGDVICTALEGGSNYWYMIVNKDMKRVVDATPHMKNEPTVDRIVEAVFEKGVEVDFYDIEEAYNPEAEKLGTLSVERIQRYQDLKYDYLLEKLLLVQIIKNNDISNEQDLINILSIYPEQIRRALQTEYHDYVKSPEKYFKNIPKGLSLF